MTSVLIADRHPLYCDGLTALLLRHEELTCFGYATDASQVREMIRGKMPDVTVLDTALCDTEAAMSMVRDLQPACATLLLTERASSAELRWALACGAHGYLSRAESGPALVQAVLDVAHGRHAFDRDVLTQVVAAAPAPPAPTARELSALRLVANGMSNREVAAQLRLSHGTVRNYVSSVIAKTNARNRVDAIRIARELAWI